MVASIRELCALVAVAAVASSSVVKADTCSTSQTDDTTTVLTQYTTDLSSYCSVYPCSDDCISAMSSLAESLPDCEYIDGVNYYDTMQQAVAACASISGSATSGGADTTTGASSSVASDSTECSASDLSSTESYINQYSSTVSANCDSDACTSDCIATVTELTNLLPNCVYSDGTNYYETFGAITSVCMGTSVSSATSSEGSTTTASGSACSKSELSDTDSYLAAINTEYTAACTDNSCTSTCLDVLDTLSKQLPDCVYTDGTNYYESVELIISSCGSTTTGSSTTGTTASSGSGSSPSALRTLSPGATKDSSSKGSNGAAGVPSISAVVIAAALGVAQLFM